MAIIYEELDPEVVPIVKFFNANGLPTSMSCQGHNRRNMSMFWIRFAKSVTEDDIVRFQRLYLNRYGNFTSCGRFVQRLIAFENDISRNWEYMAATTEAAQCDLQKWKTTGKWLETAQKRDVFLAECDKLNVTYEDDGSVSIEVETEEGSVGCD